jgi:hypothetical protein
MVPLLSLSVDTTSWHVNKFPLPLGGRYSCTGADPRRNVNTAHSELMMPACQLTRCSRRNKQEATQWEPMGVRSASPTWLFKKYSTVVF